MKNYITKEGAEKLRAEYQRLHHEERPKLVETVAWAASNGDRSENADYIYGKRRLREIDRRLQFLQDRLESAEVVDVPQITVKSVVFGATVYLDSEEGEHHYQIVGEDEIDLEMCKISWRSPVARALLGKKVGDIVIIHRPKGEIEVEVMKIEYK